MTSSLTPRPVRPRGAGRLVAVALCAMSSALWLNAAQAAAPAATPANSQGHRNMTEAESQAFIANFEKAWSTRNDADFIAIWHPEGQLIYPFASRIIKGKELPLLNAITKKSAPDLKWRMLGWTGRGNVIVVEWESSNRYGDRLVTWRGVDKMTIVDGKIMEEIVYADTAPFQAMRRGEVFPALITLPDPIS